MQFTALPGWKENLTVLKMLLKDIYKKISVGSAIENSKRIPFICHNIDGCHKPITNISLGIKKKSQ